MRFKTWVLKEIGGNGAGGDPPVQRPDLLATAMPGFIDRKTDPIPNKKSPTKKYAVTIKK